MDNLEKLKYPIGRFKCPEDISNEDLEKWISILETLPERLSNLVKNFSEEQLNTPYRKGGWTVRQVVHHIADSHHNSYIRFKWALTENRPLIKVYEEKEWSKLIDARTAPISLSLTYLSALHAKLVYMLKHLSSQDLKRSFIHPVGNINVSIAENIGKYAWHGSHHFAHIESLALREKW